MRYTRRLPAEWEPQQAVVLTWPHADGDWGEGLADAEHCLLAMSRAIAPRQRLIIVCHDAALATRVRRLTHGLPNVEPLTIPSNDIWARDHGPIAVEEAGRIKLLDFRFNGWGGKFPAERDDAITASLAAAAFPGLPYERIERVLEGGSIDSDGAGTVLTTSRCLLHPNRNPGLDRRHLEQLFERWFGTQRVLWLEHGELEGDDTDSHVDMLARFVGPDTIAYTACDDPSDPHHQPLQAMAEELRGLRTAAGEPYRLVSLPWPPARYDSDGSRLPLSYANFLLINDAVLVPTYGVATDGRALATLGALFPQREVIAIPSLPLIRQHGAVHCASMHIPA